jgi:hypothetical protein
MLAAPVTAAASRIAVISHVTQAGKANAGNQRRIWHRRARRHSAAAVIGANHDGFLLTSPIGRSGTGVLYTLAARWHQVAGRRRPLAARGIVPHMLAAMLVRGAAHQRAGAALKLRRAYLYIPADAVRALRSMGPWGCALQPARDRHRILINIKIFFPPSCRSSARAICADAELSAAFMAMTFAVSQSTACSQPVARPRVTRPRR